jgi:3-oxoacyl-[acyl-carrier-protein] synthase II
VTERPPLLITGVGIVSPLGLDAEEHFERLVAAESAVVASGRANHAVSCNLQARVSGFELRKMVCDRMLRKLLTPAAAYAVVAAGQALADAGLAKDHAVLRSCGLYGGTEGCDLDPDLLMPALNVSMDRDQKVDLARFASAGIHLVDPLFLIKHLPNGGLGGIAIEHQVTGPNLNIINGSVSGLQAVVTAANAIWRGEAEVALAGGFDSLLGVVSAADHLIAGRLAGHAQPPASACRPFDCNRAGYVLGEGAAFVTLETAAHARRRSAPAYGVVLGTGQTTGTGISVPVQDAIECLQRAAELALAGAGCQSTELDAVFGDGLAVEYDDLIEAGAVAALGATAVPYTAATPAIGFTRAASGTFALVHALLAVHQQRLPPMLNCSEPDPRCQMAIVNEPMPGSLERVLVWNSDRGARNVAVLLGSKPAVSTNGPS